MSIKKAEHHSIIDWDFQTGMYKALDTTVYVSAPSSLKCTYVAGTPVYATLLCRHPDTLCIAQGEVRTWYRSNDRTSPFFLVFRNQKPLGEADYNNCYFWSITGNMAYLIRRIDGVPLIVGNFSFAYWLVNTWYQWRTIYWNGINLLGVPALNVELYQKVGAEWVKLGSTLYDVANQWATSKINRSGLGGDVNNVYLKYFDDTEIWGAI